MWFLTGLVSVQAQTIITAQHIEQLQSVQQIDFNDLPPSVGEIANGQFFANEDGTRFALVNRQGQIIIMDDTGAVAATTNVILTEDKFPATFIDGAFGFNQFVSVHSIGSGFVVTDMDSHGDYEQITILTSDRPVAIWTADDAIWLEIIPEKPNLPPYLMRLDEESQSIRPFAPAQEEHIVVRIGRLAPPVAVTITEDREVQRWNLETGEQINQVNTGEMPLYGHMLPGSEQMVWRDPASTALHVLDFATGKDRVVAPLDGRYVPFLFLNYPGDAILGVNVDDEPVVVAWLVEGGRRIPLGPYRQCNRPPDMVRLTTDGSTLIVGCDTGLDIWRVPGKEIYGR